MLDNREVPIQESIYTILRTRLLALIQLPAADRARHAFLPADVRKVVYGLLYPGLLALVHDELLQFLLVSVCELREIELALVEA